MSAKIVVDLVISARYIIPIEPEDVFIENCALVVNKGLIVDLLSQADAIEKYEPLEHVRLSDHHALLPGLINAHTHAGMQHMRGMAEDLPLSDWLATQIWPTEARLVNHEFVYDGTELAVAEMIKSGTTCFSDMYFFPEAAVAVLEKTHMRGVLGAPLFDFPTAYAHSFDDYVVRARQLHQLALGKPLIRIAIAPHAPYTVSEDNLVTAWKLAEELNVPYHIHLHETEDEVTHSLEGLESMSRHRSTELCRPLKNFNRLGLVGPRLVAVHMTQLNSEEIDLLGKSKSNVVHCPYSNLKLASGFCKVQELIDAGVNVALGTDSVASNNDLSMLAEAKLAASLGKAVAKSAAAIKGACALRMATLNGARALGLDHEIGSFKIGKAADAIAIELKGVENFPIFNPITHITYTDRGLVTDSWVAGRRLLNNTKLTTIDEADLHTRALRWHSVVKHPQALV